MSGPGFAGVTGRVFPIVQYPDPVLSTPCAPVEVFDDHLRQLVADMFASMYAAAGVGLAANQIGISARVFVYDCPDADERMHRGVVINPVLEVPDVGERNLDDDDEGCLSVLHQHASVARPDHSAVRGVDANGDPVRVEGTGVLARCLQHETDHLNGLLYIDRISAKARRKVLKGHAEVLAELAEPQTD